MCFSKREPENKLNAFICVFYFIKNTSIILWEQKCVYVCKTPLNNYLIIPNILNREGGYLWLCHAKKSYKEQSIWITKSKFSQTSCIQDDCWQLEALRAAFLSIGYFLNFVFSPRIPFSHVVIKFPRTSFLVLNSLTPSSSLIRNTLYLKVKSNEAL